MEKTFIPNLLTLISGICWIAVYIFIIRRNYKDKTYGIPLAAFSANIMWEFFYCFVAPFPPPQLYINGIWFGLNLVIFVQILTYIKKEYPNRPALFIYSLVLLSLPVTYFIIYFSHQANIVPVSSAYAQNFMMSILFITMLLKRNSARGQTIYIAILKALGTMLISILFYYVYKAYRQLNIMAYLYLAIVFFDTLYIFMLFFQIKKEGENPWLRW